MSYCWPVHIPFCYTSQKINIKSDKCASWPWFIKNKQTNKKTKTHRVTVFLTAGYTCKHRFLHWSHVLLSKTPALWERLLFTPSRAIRSSASCPRTPRHDDCRGRGMKHHSVNVYSNHWARAGFSAMWLAECTLASSPSVSVLFLRRETGQS